MDKEKEIEEMEEVALRSGHSNDGYIEFDYRDIAEYFYKAGYRKADEVRKETIREISTWLHEHYRAEFLGLFDKTFGIEVDE